MLWTKVVFWLHITLKHNFSLHGPTFHKLGTNVSGRPRTRHCNFGQRPPQSGTTLGAVLPGDVTHKYRPCDPRPEPLAGSNATVKSVASHVIKKKMAVSIVKIFD
jgi:hypothetical protein